MSLKRDQPRASLFVVCIRCGDRLRRIVHGEHSIYPLVATIARQDQDTEQMEVSGVTHITKGLAAVRYHLSVRNFHLRCHLTNLISVLRVLRIRDERRSTARGPVNARNGVGQPISELGVDCGLNTRFTQVLAILAAWNREPISRGSMEILNCPSPFTEMNSKEVPTACGT